MLTRPENANQMDTAMNANLSKSAVEKEMKRQKRANEKMKKLVGYFKLFKDIGCLESTRVVLDKTAASGNDYIHANFISTPFKQKRFICTQAPLPSTAYDFWQMILQNGCCIIVMLCNIEENGKPKVPFSLCFFICFEYWSREPGTSVKFDNITVKTVVVRKLKLHPECSGTVTIQISGLAIMVDDVFYHAVDHFQWLNWPDRKVPPADLTPISLLNYIRKSKTPIVVHCTAGIGRTGTLIMMAYILETLVTGQKPESSNEILKRLRSERAYLLQSDAQYLYVHRVLLEYFALKGLISDYMADRVTNFIEDYEAAIN
ncbi:unnamed protein product [Anisakis simplex]|uniref:Protein-tyrosine phosphatase n=1 Tax=Anisakis simplex TaxID=6269 RepID=A0A0M3K9M3_ANISI|nr:unnamed protein product [Anisakis simplex]